ncbi:MAG TPA: L,D-transpeptidase, partial [Candidatus Dormibacteraeota bacterium]|nr:L,D-transpeptidase [Candidatus Dormibacteraeota bacterium]
MAAVVLAAVGVQAGVGASRHSDYSEAAAQLESVWQHDVAMGLPASAVAPLQAELDASQPPAWWSPDWWQNSPASLIDDLRSRTQQVWDAALSGGRTQAQSILTQADALVSSAKGAAPASFVAGVAEWAGQIADAGTPSQLVALTAQYQSAVDDARAKVHAVQAQAAAAAAAAAAKAAAVRASSGYDGLLAEVAALDATAAADNLDISAVDGIAAELRFQAAGGQDLNATAARLTAAISAFRGVVTTNDQIAQDMQPLHWEVEQAVVEGTTNSASFAAQFDPIQKAFPVARTSADIESVRSQQTALRALVDAELAASVCGHPVPPGKLLVISLSAQEMIVYQDGCVVRATPVTTGRPQLPTPPGNYKVFYKASPFTMVSPWPYGSQFWYPTTKVTWVMEFLAGGYFIHD